MSFLTDPKDYTFLAEVEHEGRTFKKYRNEAEGYDLWWISDQEVWYENEALFHLLNKFL